MSTSFYPPFLLARLSATLDHICRGRFGWNIVTSGEDRAAQNFGMDKLTEHDLRYDMADEYVDLVCQLWDSWEPDAVVMDHETGVYADGSKVHTIDFAGRYYQDPRAAEHGACPARPSRRSCRPAVHPAAGSSRPSTPTRSSPRRRASRA